MRESQIKEIKALYSSKQRIVSSAASSPDFDSDNLKNKLNKQAFFNSVLQKLNINTTDKS